MLPVSLSGGPQWSALEGHSDDPVLLVGQFQDDFGCRKQRKLFTITTLAALTVGITKIPVQPFRMVGPDDLANDRSSDRIPQAESAITHDRTERHERSNQFRRIYVIGA